LEAGRVGYCVDEVHVLFKRYKYDERKPRTESWMRTVV
jgi:hypothetical protein